MKYLTILTIILLFLTSCATKTAKSEFDFANMMAKNNLWKEAMMRWEGLLPKMKDSAKLYNNLALAYERLGEFEKADTAYKKALKLSPKNSFIKSNYKHFQTKGEKNGNEQKKRKNHPNRKNK